MTLPKRINREAEKKFQKPLTLLIDLISWQNMSTL